MVIVQSEPFQPAQLLEQFIGRVPDAGAIVSFTGCVRPTNKDAEIAALQLLTQEYDEAAQAAKKKSKPAEPANN